MEELFERIRQYVDGHHDEMLALWEEMVNTESGSRQLEGVAAMDDILRRELESVGAKVRVLPVENAGGVLVAEWNSGSPKAPLLFIGHVDTVFKEGTAEDNPFRIDEQGRAHGPGVLDMKAGLVPSTPSRPWLPPALPAGPSSVSLPVTRRICICSPMPSR